MAPRFATEASLDEIKAEIYDIAKLAAKRPNVLLGTGALPYDSSPDRVLFMKHCAEELGSD